MFLKGIVIKLLHEHSPGIIADESINDSSNAMWIPYKLINNNNVKKEQNTYRVIVFMIKLGHCGGLELSS